MPIARVGIPSGGDPVAVAVVVAVVVPVPVASAEMAKLREELADAKAMLLAAAQRERSIDLPQSTYASYSCVCWDRCIA